MAKRATSDALSLAGVSAGYGETVILEDIDLAVRGGSCLAVLGRNGVGKSTLLSTVVGRTRLRSGRIELAGEAIQGYPTYRRSSLGLGFVPQEREVFPSLSVEENLLVAGRSPAGAGRAWTTERVYGLFPRLAERRRNMGNQLSGGEQQMLSIGRALMGNISLLLLDEPFEGLAPVIIDQLAEAIGLLGREERLTIVLVEQHARLALEMSERAIILDRGRIVHEERSVDLARDMSRLAVLMGVAQGQA
ncbi:ABC transporter ATP-binding protein [Enterovirga sp.]|uniref:ABC transporter ATP-binding protein n=1 Tax=Enterovirga sp. TaxID=2026350 RepID=UPI002617B909|nr:ABC transporter ATP-binding protein [Enterovirga sp.]MDB5592886.1 transporter ATP-binding protein [Enterovirga sp.]